MKILSRLPTVLLVVTTVAAESIWIKDVNKIDNFYKQYADLQKPLDNVLQVHSSVRRSNERVEDAEDDMPHLDRDDSLMDADSCTDVAVALVKKPFTSGISFWNRLKTKEVLCAAKDGDQAKGVEYQLRESLNSWQDYIEAYNYNCNGNPRRLVYERWENPSKALKETIAAWKDWKAAGCPAFEDDDED